MSVANSGGTSKNTDGVPLQKSSLHSLAPLRQCWILRIKTADEIQISLVFFSFPLAWWMGDFCLLPTWHMVLDLMDLVVCPNFEMGCRASKNIEFAFIKWTFFVLKGIVLTHHKIISMITNYYFTCGTFGNIRCTNVRSKTNPITPYHTITN